MRFRGFTLVELLVVIAVIALLAALLFPVFHSARQQARATVCQAHIRQLAIEFHQYEAEHETLPYGIWAMRAPPRGGNITDARYDVPGCYWPNFIGAAGHSSSRDSKILECPSKYLQDPGLARHILCGNYGANRSLCRSAADISFFSQEFPGPPLSTARIRHPGSTLLLVDSGYALICWWDVAAEPPKRYSGPLAASTAYIPGLGINMDRELLPGQIEDAIGGRHPNKTVNVGFADGHVDRMKASALAVEKEGEADDTPVYRNRAPLWDPR
jgi:prepilin-type N-terminal cleavage/methylation domain-containing protein/prepilin-type processing-associated H-X9-DG protein